MMVANSNDEAKPLLVGSGCTGPFLSLDGFAFTKQNISEDLTINSWSHWQVKKIPIAFDDMIPANVTHKGKTIRVLDYKLFIGLIKSWVNAKEYKLTKEQALDLYFEIGG